MNALDLNYDMDPDTTVDEDGDRESHTQLISRKLASPPWMRNGTTFLEQALAESVLVDGGLCVIQEIDAHGADAPAGSFEILEVASSPFGDIESAKPSRYVAIAAPIPLVRRRRSPSNDG